MLENPNKAHTNASIKPILSNKKRFKRKGIFKIKIRNKMAPPTTHLTDLLGVTRIWKIVVLHERFDRITAILDAINATKVIALTAFSE